MRWLPVFKKEMRLYFGSPVAYAVATFFLFIAGCFFSRRPSSSTRTSRCASAMQPQMGQSLNATENILRPLTYNMAVVLLFFIPMLTMRLFAGGEALGHHGAAADLPRARRRGPRRASSSPPWPCTPPSSC